MHFAELVTKLKQNKYPIFGLEDLLLFFPKTNRQTLKTQIYLWVKKGLILSVRRGLYLLNYPEREKVPEFYLANKIYEPSYISCETALSMYGIIPEYTFAVTSVTTRPTRQFKNSFGLFLYQTIKKSLFTGYALQEYSGFKALIATPPKALLDFFYLKNRRVKKIDFEQERLDKDELRQVKPGKLKKFLPLYGSDKLKKTVRQLYAYIKRDS